MRHVLNKLNAAWHATVPVRKQSVKAERARETAKNWTTLEAIVLVALTTFPLVLFHGLRTEEGNQKQKREGKPATTNDI